MCACITMTLQHDGGWRVYNIGTGKGISVLELLRGMERASGQPTLLTFTNGKY